MRKLVDLTFHRVSRCFLAGVIAILPLAITVAIVAWVGGLVAQFLGPNAAVGQLLSRLGLQFVSNPSVAYALGAVLVVAAIFAVGVAVEVGAKNLIQRLFDAALQRIPVVGSLYGTSKQLVGLVDKREDADLRGMKPVFCFFGGQHGGGILALLVSPEKFRISGLDYHVIIVPTSPVPVGGGLLFVPADIVQPADLSVEGLMSIYMSMGVTAPKLLPVSTKS